MGYLFGKMGYLRYFYSVIKKQIDYEHNYVTQTHRTENNLSTIFQKRRKSYSDMERPFQRRMGSHLSERKKAMRTPISSNM